MHPLESFRDALQASIKKSAKEVIKISEGEAWIMPDGAVILHDGILPKLITADDLSAIINHAVKPDKKEQLKKQDMESADNGIREEDESGIVFELPCGMRLYYDKKDNAFYTFFLNNIVDPTSRLTGAEVAQMNAIMTKAPHLKREESAFEKAIKEHAERQKIIFEKREADKKNQ